MSSPNDLDLPFYDHENYPDTPRFKYGGQDQRIIYDRKQMEEEKRRERREETPQQKREREDRRNEEAQRHFFEQSD